MRSRSWRSRFETGGAPRPGAQGRFVAAVSMFWTRNAPGLSGRPTRNRHHVIALRNLSAVVAAIALSSAPVAAQGSPSLTIEPGVLQAGGSAVIVYKNPSLAGRTVVIDVDNGMRKNTEIVTLTVALDANGVGKVDWRVPGWWGANFNAPGVPEVHAPILR